MNDKGEITMAIAMGLVAVFTFFTIGIEQGKKPAQDRAQITIEQMESDLGK